MTTSVIRALMLAITLLMGLPLLRLPPSYAQAPPVNAAATPPSLTAREQSELGQKLDTSDFLQPGFLARFPQEPIWRTGHPPWPPVPRPLNAPDMRWMAGYLHATPGNADHPTPPFWPAWSFGSGVDAYPNADAMQECGINPFSVHQGILSITARPLPAAQAACLPQGQQGGTDWSRKAYLSGGMISYPYSQKYGYFEIKARFPAGHGLWPAFWLLPVSGQWDAEIDAVEWLGRDPLHYYASSMGQSSSGPTSDPRHVGRQVFQNKIAIPNPSADFHLYGVDVGPEKLRFYFDRTLVALHPTRETDKQPMYLVANLAVGGSWGGGNPIRTGPWTMEIAAITAWQRQRYLHAP